jgi:quercetin 2,3-dioxygenase
MNRKEELDSELSVSESSFQKLTRRLDMSTQRQSNSALDVDTKLNPFAGILPGKPAPFWLERGEGEKSVVFDTLFTIMLSGDETDGQFGVFTCEGPTGEMIPPHLHPAQHEIFYILDGAVRVWMDDENGFQEDRVLRAGDFGYVPAKTVHAFKMESPSKILGVNTGGFERFFHGIGTPTTETVPPKIPYIPSQEQFIEAGKKYGHVFRPDVRFGE